MSKENKKSISYDELNMLIQRRKRQLAFDKYPKKVQEVMTRFGLNPYDDSPEERIEYREFTVTSTRKDK